jgi:uncharacterized protein
MSRIFWDTNIYIYLLEGTGPSAMLAIELRNKILQRGDQLITSTLTLGEILVKPNAAGDADLCRMYEERISASSVLVPFDVEAAKRFAAIRRDRSVRPPDAIQLACASVARVDLFVTNDDRLHGKQIAGVQFIVPLERSPL